MDREIPQFSYNGSLMSINNRLIKFRYQANCNIVCIIETQKSHVKYNTAGYNTNYREKRPIVPSASTQLQTLTRKTLPCSCANFICQTWPKVVRVFSNLNPLDCSKRSQEISSRYSLLSALFARLPLDENRRVYR